MREKKTNTSQCKKWNSITCKSGKLYQLGREFIQQNKNTIRSFRFKVMNSPIYSIQREVIKEL